MGTGLHTFWLTAELCQLYSCPVGRKSQPLARRSQLLARKLNQKIGFVFQSFNLLPRMSALENVEVPLLYSGKKKAKDMAMSALDRVGLTARAHHEPNQLSGGQRQRVAIARALVTNPAIVLADEPTGNLDAETGENVEKLLFDLNREAGTTLILVTHDLTLASKTQRIIHMKGGKLVEDEE